MELFILLVGREAIVFDGIDWYWFYGENFYNSINKTKREHIFWYRIVLLTLLVLLFGMKYTKLILSFYSFGCISSVITLRPLSAKKTYVAKHDSFLWIWMTVKSQNRVSLFNFERRIQSNNIRLYWSVIQSLISTSSTWFECNTAAGHHPPMQ